MHSYYSTTTTFFNPLTASPFPRFLSIVLLPTDFNPGPLVIIHYWSKSLEAGWLRQLKAMTSFLPKFISSQYLSSESYGHLASSLSMCNCEKAHSYIYSVQTKRARVNL